PEGGLKKADGTYDYTKIGDLKTYNEVQDNSADDIGKKITVGNAKKIVKEDMAGKFELGADSEIVKKAGLENDYSDNAIVYDLKNTSDNDDTLDYIEQLVTLNKGNEKYIEDLIKKSGLIKKEGWKPGTFNDDKYYDKLQKLGLFK
ncbi:hypothetical protein EOM39_07280, partial [Candidatus Gracilibacteria bacterium]|nr:hypothetical protein [Candidatus Gracilibacteria bacterium]